MFILGLVIVIVLIFMVTSRRVREEQMAEYEARQAAMRRAEEEEDYEGEFEEQGEVIDVEEADMISEDAGFSENEE